MQRREFCKLIAAAAAARAIPANGQSAAGTTAGFNKLHQTYEEFCATPESERTFYVAGGRQDRGEKAEHC